jgi:hypothetical protein
MRLNNVCRSESDDCRALSSSEFSNATLSADFSNLSFSSAIVAASARWRSCENRRETNHARRPTHIQNGGLVQTWLLKRPLRLLFHVLQPLFLAIRQLSSPRTHGQHSKTRLQTGCGDDNSQTCRSSVCCCTRRAAARCCSN